MLLTDRRTSMLGLGAQYDSFRRKMARDDGSSHHGSLERQKLTPDKRSSWTSEDIGAAIDSFKPIIVTVSSFFKQVCIHIVFNYVLNQYI